MVLCGSGYQVCRICSSLLHCCSSNSLFQTKCYSIYSLYSSQIPCESPTEFWLVLGPFCCVLAPEHQTPANDGRSIRRADMGRFWSKVEHTFVSGNWADLDLSLITSRAAKWKWKIKKRNGEMVTFWSTWQHLPVHSAIVSSGSLVVTYQCFRTQRVALCAVIAQMDHGYTVHLCQTSMMSCWC